MFIDDVEVKPSMQFKFDTVGEHNVKIFFNKNVSSLSQLFGGNQNIKKADFSNLKTEKITTLSALFISSSIEEVIFGEDNFKNVEDISAMFNSCQKIKNVSFNGLASTKLKSMGTLFIGASNLETFDLSDLDTQNITSLGGMFGSNDLLTEIDLSKNDFSNVTSYAILGGGGQFSNLKTIKLGENFANASTSSFSFYNILTSTMLNDTELIIGNNSFINCTEFNGAGNIGKVVIGDNCFTNATKVSFESCSNLKELKLGKNFGKNNTSMSRMFSGCYNLTSLDLSNLDTSKVIEMEQCFRSCYNLTSITFGDKFDTSNVTNMSYMFDRCSGLTSLDISSFNTSKVKDINRCFSYCSNLEEIILPDNFGCGDTENVSLYNMERMFSYCKSLKSIDASKLNTSNTAYLGGLFYGCESLESIDISYLDLTNITSGFYEMFVNCLSLTSVTMTQKLDFNNDNSMFFNSRSETKEITTTGEFICDLNYNFYGLQNIPNNWVFKPIKDYTVDVRVCAIGNGDYVNHGTINGVEGVYDEETKILTFTNVPKSKDDENLLTDIFESDGLEKEIELFLYKSNNTYPATLQNISIGNNQNYNFELTAKYNVTSTTEPTIIRYSRDVYRSINFLSVLIDGVEVDYVTSYQFDTTGEHTVQFIAPKLHMNESISTLETLFSGATQLTYVDFDGIDTSNVTDIDRIFYNCINLKYIRMNLGGTAQVSSTDYAIANVPYNGGLFEYNSQYDYSKMKIPSGWAKKAY